MWRAIDAPKEYFENKHKSHYAKGLNSCLVRYVLDWIQVAGILCWIFVNYWIAENYLPSFEKNRLGSKWHGQHAILDQL